MKRAPTTLGTRARNLNGCLRRIDLRLRLGPRTADEKKLCETGVREGICGFFICHSVKEKVFDSFLGEPSASRS